MGCGDGAGAAAYVEGLAVAVGDDSHDSGVTGDAAGSFGVDYSAAVVFAATASAAFKARQVEDHHQVGFLTAGLGGVAVVEEIVTDVGERRRDAE